MYNYISNAIESLYCIYILKNLSNRKILLHLRDVILLFINTIVISNLHNESIYPFILGYLIFLIYSFFTFAEEKLHGFLLVNYTFLFITVAQIICTLIMTVISIPTHLSYFPVIANSLTLIVVITLIHLLPIKRLYLAISNSEILYQIIFCNIFLLQIIFFIFLKLSPKDLYSKITTTSVVILIMLSINIWLLYYDQKLKKQAEEFARYKQNSIIYENLLHDIRATQHEYSNHIQTLQYFTVSCETYEDLVNAINNYTRNDVKTLRAYPLLKINMPILAAALYNQYKHADSKNIAVRFDVTNEVLSSNINEVILSDCCSILLQNAIEASKINDIVYVNLGMEHGKFHFETRNIVDRYITNSEISKFFKKGHTTKANQKPDGLVHGYGLYALKNIIDKNNGIICAQCIEHNKKYYYITFIEL